MITKEYVFIIVGLIIASIGLIALIVLACTRTTKTGNDFRDGQSQIKIGMNKFQVRRLMGMPTVVKTHADGNEEWIYEKDEWKGFLRGGTKTRRVEVVFKGDTVVSVYRNSNAGMSGW